MTNDFAIDRNKRKMTAKRKTKRCVERQRNYIEHNNNEHNNRKKMRYKVPGKTGNLSILFYFPIDHFIILYIFFSLQKQYYLAKIERKIRQKHKT